ncbi:Predicted arabinose efflux permease, MFS family [Corynebacterium mycetoides]|uniref:Predicted arabinose efflux permease, MFS family n=1 Tax=Corynebacterium mycetoides TaxID=38302 RepID=A0A1G9N5G3_9CORY|nr:MFS transporter [Corynebacterium mycetoides]SDL81541.1 Predicted arabinose efflux permease, MFS family [Corynebacterium mycetoides]
MDRVRSRGVLTPEEVNSVTSPWRARGLVPTLIAVAAAFGAWSLLLPVVPTAVLDAGGSEALAGGSTGAFMAATVLTQVFVPRLLRRFGYRAVIACASLLLGVPAIGYALGMDPAIVLTVSVIRGVGFGALSVAEAAIITELVPLRLLGRTTGIFGLSVGFSQMVALPSGLALAELVGYVPVYALATAIGLVGLAVCVRIPAIPKADPNTADLTSVRVPLWRLVAVPMLALTLVTTAYGAVTNFLPVSVRDLDPAAGAAFGGVLLAVLNLAAMISRYYAGIVLDRRGIPGTVLIPFQIYAAAGILLIAVVLWQEASVWWLVVAAFLYGAGFGAVQNESLTLLFYRLPKSKASEASAMWNISFDGGTGVGSTVYGMMLASMTMAPMFGVAGAVVSVGVVITVADYALGRHRVAEVNNLAVRLKSVQSPRTYTRFKRPGR